MLLTFFITKNAIIYDGEFEPNSGNEARGAGFKFFPLKFQLK